MPIKSAVNIFFLHLNVSLAVISSLTLDLSQLRILEAYCKRSNVLSITQEQHFLPDGPSSDHTYCQIAHPIFHN